MSEWSYSEEELDEYFRDPSQRRRAEASDDAPDEALPPDDRPQQGLRGFFHRRIDDVEQAQAAFTLSLLVGALLVVTLGGGLYLWSLTDELPSTQSLENPSFQLATVAYTADGEELARYARQNRSWLPYDSISTHARHALLAVEDQRFYSHWGVDIQGIFAAIADLVLQGDLRGASTVTQQLARNLFNEKVGRAVTIERKLKEMVTAVELERRYTKPEIIEMYLNTVSFGSNAYGIEAAARTYFGKSAKDLTPTEAATLIATLRATSYYNPVRHPDRAKNRRNLVLRLMAQRGFIADSLYQNQRETPVNAEYNSASLHASLAPYFAEYVRNWMQDWAETHDRDLYGDGLRVYTTLDSELQAEASAAVDTQTAALQRVVDYEWSEASPPGADTPNPENFAAYFDKKPGKDFTPFSEFWQRKPRATRAFIRSTDRFEALQEQGTSERDAIAQLMDNAAFMDSLRQAKTRLSAGMVSIDPRTGHVKAWVGGRDFKRDKYDKVALAKRQPGSTFKPFVYTAAIDNGYSPYDTLKDSTFTWEAPDSDSTWTPSNFGGSSGQMLTLSQGLARSKNTITARLMLNLKPSTVAYYARAMGIESKLNEVPSLALGTSNVSLLEMTSAYSTLAAGGLHRPPTVVTRIEDRYGNVLYEDTPTAEEALSERTAYTVVDMLRGVIDYGTGVRIRTQFELGDYDLAGKTGTTQRSADGWFMMMHPDLVTGAWVGFNDSRVTFRTNYWGQGAHTALLLVGDYLRRATSRQPPLGLSRNEFPMVEAYGPAERGARDSTNRDGGIGW
jgi:penicillin-binding protein 1A